jgi:hypothetical protein
LNSACLLCVARYGVCSGRSSHGAHPMATMPQCGARAPARNRFEVDVLTRGQRVSRRATPPRYGASTRTPTESARTEVGATDPPRPATPTDAARDARVVPPAGRAAYHCALWPLPPGPLDPHARMHPPGSPLHKHDVYLMLPHARCAARSSEILRPAPGGFGVNVTVIRARPSASPSRRPPHGS